MATEQRQILCQAVREDGVWTDMPDDYAVLMARIARDPTAIGILGFSHLDQNREPIQAATIDGVAPAYPSIGAWRYALARPFFDYVGKSPVNVIPGLAGFVREFVSERTAGADRYLVDKGLAPAPPSSLRLERAKALARAGSPR